MSGLGGGEGEGFREIAYPNRLNGGGVVAHSSRLINRYPAAYKDFFGTPSGAPCIYKSGPVWPVREGPEAQRYICEAPPVYGHPIANDWLKIGTDIYQALDALDVKWTSIDPVAFANAGEKKPFCSLLMWIGVKHETLAFEAAVTAAGAVEGILRQAGFPKIEVAFRDSSPSTPSFDPISEFRKAFAPTLGLSIAPLTTPYYEGTGALYFRLGRDDDRVALLTTAHVARPPPQFANTGMSRKGTSQPREEIVALGTMGCQNATNAMMATIGNPARSVAVWKKVIKRLGEPVDGENEAVTARRLEIQGEVEKAAKMIDSLNKLHDEVTKPVANLDQRVIGCVVHAEPIVISDGPHRFTCDWAFVYIGSKLSPSDFGKFMFPQPEDQADYEYPDDGLLQAFDVVKDHKIRQPHHLDVHCEKVPMFASSQYLPVSSTIRCQFHFDLTGPDCASAGYLQAGLAACERWKVLMVVKNGLTTGTTIGRVNGLDSFTRVCSQYGIMGTSIETDMTYWTPYWWLEERVKKAFPGGFLYEVAG
ncbi:hypothetical protein HOY80DRAFT_1012275 [Tuber brumale]|nr:hypothetical protein HOY80DRAFT_1012275 [Tuber brumale]